MRAERHPGAYCQMVSIQSMRLQQNVNLLHQNLAVPAAANNLFTFLAIRLNSPSPTSTARTSD